MRDAGKREGARGNLGPVHRLSGKDSAQGVGGMTPEKILERLAGVPMRMEIGEQPRDGVRDFVGGAAIADGTRDGGKLADAATNAEVVGVHHLAVDLDFLTFDA